jgi:hypothetical protein
VTAATAAGLAGVYDDLVGDAGNRGLAGHLGALTRGEVTTGAVKLAALGTAGVVAGRLVRGRTDDRLVAGFVVAGSANLANLLDLRPGRAMKVAALVAVPALAGRAAAPMAGVIGAGVAVLPDELAERTMLGDAGAGALGAAVGVGFVAGASTRSLRRGALLIAALTLLSERVSFSRVIDSVPALRAIDQWGRK